MKPVAYFVSAGHPIAGGHTEILWSESSMMQRVDQLKQRGCEIGVMELCQITPALQELVEAAINLDNVKGRHHSQIAMERLSKAAKAFKEASK